MRALVVGLAVFSSLCFADGPGPRAPRLDPKFGVRGLADLRTPGRATKRLGEFPAFTAVAAASDGRTFSLLSKESLAGAGVVATRSDGRADRSFGDGGFVRLDGMFSSIHVDSHDRPVLVGMAADVSRSRPTVPVLARLTPRGELDATFGDRGVVRLGETTDFARPLAALVPDGSDSWIVVLQRPTDDWSRFVSYDRRVLRIDAAGSLDTAYDGVLPSVVHAAQGTASPPFIDAVAADAAGRVVLAEDASPPADGAPATVTVTRLTSSGRLDADFGAGGATVLDFVGRPAVMDLKIDARGRPVVLVRRTIPVLLRLTPQGALDPDWGPDGNGAATLPGPAIVDAAAFVVAGDRYLVACLVSLSVAPGTEIQVRSVADSDAMSALLLAFPRRRARGHRALPLFAGGGREFVVGGAGRDPRGRPRPFVARVLVD